MATEQKQGTTQEQKNSQAVKQHHRMAMGGNVNGKTQTGSVPQTKQIPA